MTTGKEPYSQMSLLDFFKRFPNEGACWAELVRLRWPKGRACPDCRRAMGFVQTRRLFQCGRCRKQISVTAGTVFHQSHTPLQKWFWAIFLIANAPKGVSARYLQKQLGIKHYRTAWLMGHKIRHAMMQREGLYKLKGKVQVDEMQIGYSTPDIRREKRQDNRTRFLMAVQEGPIGNPRFVTFEQLESFFKKDLLAKIDKAIEKGSTLKSDGNASYRAAKDQGYEVDPIPFDSEPDKAKEHLKWIHWVSSNIKRGLVSTYHGCFPKYRKAYLAEFAYRFNRRHWPRQAFDRLLTACIHGQCKTLDQIRK